ncbi:MAG: hypothetical protein E6J91_12545 [Deltaproteobacteria bacterium]|nr:MAG: hypothetical protein E6J91_12545 [Deltaproteobacteria bacterium]
MSVSTEVRAGLILRAVHDHLQPWPASLARHCAPSAPPAIHDAISATSASGMGASYGIRTLPLPSRLCTPTVSVLIRYD